MSINYNDRKEPPLPNYHRRRYVIPKGTGSSKCRDCQELIYWIKTDAGKNMPVNADGVCHFETCKKRGQAQQPQVIIAPHRFNPLLDDLKSGLDALAESDEDKHRFVEGLLIVRENGQLHQMTQYPDQPRFHCLFPLEVVEQFHGITDDQAKQLCELAMRAIVDGHASPDRDWRPWWEHCIKNTVQHMLTGSCPGCGNPDCRTLH